MGNLWKKVVLAALVCCLLCFAGCGAVQTTSSGDPVVIRIGSLKGPTSLGLLSLMEASEEGNAEGSYEFQMATQADELTALMVKGDLDIALIPANVAAALYQNTDGAVQVIAINTLGVLYIVTGNDTISTVEDLRGKTIYLTGKGTTPDYALRYILSGNGMTSGDYQLEYCSEATEVAARLAEDPDAIGLLPEPFVTSACMQNEALSVVLDLNEEWNKLQGEDGSKLITGVTVVRTAFLEEHEDAVLTFLSEHIASVEAVNANPADAAALAVDAGIVGNSAIAEKAIPKCNIVCITGEEMKTALAGYLEALYDMSADSVGGALPGEEFYYLP